MDSNIFSKSAKILFSILFLFFILSLTATYYKYVTLNDYEIFLIEQSHTDVTGDSYLYPYDST